MTHNKTRNIVLAGLFIALEIILTRFLSVETPIVRVSFEFLPIAISAILFGPIPAGIIAAIADLLGVVLFGKGAPFPGFTFSAFVSGLLYGIFLFKKKITLLRTFMSVIAVSLVCTLVLNSIWLIFFYNHGAYAILTARLIKFVVFLPVQTFMIYFMWKLTGNVITQKTRP